MNENKQKSWATFKKIIPNRETHFWLHYAVIWVFWSLACIAKRMLLIAPKQSSKMFIKIAPNYKSLENQNVFFIKMGLFFVYFRSFQANIITIFTTNICEKSSFQYMVTGFEPTTIGT